jgi:hypothetical protein
MLPVHAHADLPSQAPGQQSHAQLPPGGVIHRHRDVAGVSVCIAGAVSLALIWSWVLSRDREERRDMRTALEWERETGTCVLGYEAWKREGLSPGDRITISDFERLASESATVRRADRHPMDGEA